MWVHKTRLPHVLPPAAYFSREQHEREMERVFQPGWHFACADEELPAEGSQRSLDLLGRPVVLRRAAGELPEALLGGERLRVARLGGLVFVSLAAAGPSLREHLGERTWTLGSRIFSAGYQTVVAREIEHPCNWKIPVENVLESYHVPSLHDNLLARHPELFRVFSGRRDGARVVHDLGEDFTSYHDSLGADSALYRALIGLLTPGASTDYVHHHAFPNVILAHTSIVSFLQVLTPRSPASSRSVIRVFLQLDGAAAGRLARLLAPLLRRASARLIDLVLREDAAVYPDVQRGLEASTHRGVLGSREERVHAFQEHVARACR